MAEKKSGGGGKKSGGDDSTRKGHRQKHVRVKTAKGRKISSTKWLERQLNDPFVALAKKEGYRSRAAYKLIEIDDKFHFLKPGAIIVDLGTAPGSWAQEAVKRLKNHGKIIGIDLLEIEPIAGAEFITGDFLDEETYQRLKEMIDGPVDVVMSDMAAASCGHTQTDHMRIMALCEAALEFAMDHLKPGGTFLAKVLTGGTEKDLLNQLKKHFTTVKHIKPKASRADSSEMYVLASGFRT